MQSNHRKGHEGIVVKHRTGCPRCDDPAARCKCKPGPSYQAAIWSKRDKRRVRKEFPTLEAAKAWRQEKLVGLRDGTVRMPKPTSLREAAEAWLEGARSEMIRTRSGDAYKPKTLRGYDQALRDYVLPDLGGKKISDVTRADVQALVDRIQANQLDASTIRNAVVPLRSIYRRALSRGQVAVNPTAGLELPAVRGKRDRIASPAEAEALLEALPVTDQALWATAMYAGLRLGELQALDDSLVDLGAGVIHVERSWDAKEGFIKPKSAKGRRKVPISMVLRDYLTEHRARRGSGGLIFGRGGDRPFSDSTIGSRAQRVWKARGVEPITLHECRHTFASLMIAAGVNAKALSTYMGHANIAITMDRYGHLMPGNEDEAAGLLDAYLAVDQAKRAGAAECHQECHQEADADPAARPNLALT